MIILSEPDSFTILSSQNYLTDEQVTKRLQQLLLLQCKSYLNNKAIIIKFRSQCTYQAHYIHDINQNIKLLYMYRNVYDQCLSVINTFDSISMIKCIQSCPLFLKILFLKIC